MYGPMSPRSEFYCPHLNYFLLDKNFVPQQQLQEKKGLVGILIRLERTDDPDIIKVIVREMKPLLPGDFALPLQELFIDLIYYHLRKAGIEDIPKVKTIEPEFPGRFSYHTSCPLKVSNAGVFLCGVNLQEFVDVVLNLGRLRGDNYPLEDFCMLIRHVGEHCVNRVLAGANLQL